MRSCSHTDIDSSYLYLLNYFNDVSTMEHVHENGLTARKYSGLGLYYNFPKCLALLNASPWILD